MSAFEVGMEVLHQGVRMRVVDPEYQGVVTLVSPQDESLLCQVPTKEITLAPRVVKPVMAMDGAEWFRLKRVAEAVRDILGASSTCERRTRYESHALALGCSIRTLQRAARRLREVNAVSALQASPCGRPVGMRFLDPAVEDIIANQLNEVWLVPNRPNLSDVIDQIQSECRLKQLPEPCAATIRKRAAALDARRVMVLRQGGKKAKYTLDPMVGHIQVTRLLETVQIDHTLADAILVLEADRSKSVGRPWVTFAIDVATRMVVGVYVSFEAPSAVSVAMCLANALLPKDEFLALLGLKGNWPVSGVMKSIHMDNGRDFHSDALRRGCEQIGTDIEYRPVGSPHYGGIIERLIGTFMGKCRLLPGATHSNVVQRGDYDAEGKAALTLQEFKAFLVNEIVNVYHLKEHRSLEVPPLVKWTELQSTSEHQDALPSGWDRWMLATTFYPFEMRLVRRTGIQMFNRTYWAEGLEEWVGDGIPRPVSYDPGDLSKVYIVGPGGLVFAAMDTREDVRRISLAEYQWSRQHRRGEYRDSGLLEQLDEGLSNRQSMVMNATAATRKACRQAAVEEGRRRRRALVPEQVRTTTPPPSKDTAGIDFGRAVVSMNAYRKGA